MTERREECVWKAMGNLERIRIREAGCIIKPNPDEDKCDACDGLGTIRYTLTNVSETCRNYLPNAPKTRRDLIR